MKSKMLFSKDLMFNQVRKFAPVALIYGILMFFATNMILLLPKGQGMRLDDQFLYYNPLMILLTMTIPIFLGVMYNYLFSPKGISGTLTLPFTRTQIFFSHYFAGIFLLVLPIALNTVLSLIIVAVRSSLEASMMMVLITGLHFMWMNIIIFTVSSLIATMVSSLIVHIGLTYSLLVIPPVTFMVFMQGLVNKLVYGITLADEVPSLIMKLSSPIMLFDFDGGLFDIGGNGVYYIGYSLFACLFGLFLAWLSHKKRHMENVHNWVAFGWLGKVIQYAFSIVGAILCAAFFTNMLDTNMALPWLLLGALVGYIVTSVFLLKSINILSQWKGFAFLSAIILIISGVLYFDVLGIESKVPNTSDIAEVEVYSYTLRQFGLNDTSVITNEDDINKVINLHQGIVDNYKEDRKEGSYTFRIEYTYKNGRRLQRQYYLPGKIMKENLKTLFDVNEAKLMNLPKDMKDYDFVQVNSRKGDVVITEDDKMKVFLEKVQEDLNNMTYEQRKDAFHISEFIVRYTSEAQRDKGFNSIYMSLTSAHVETLRWLEANDLLNDIRFNKDELQETIITFDDNSTQTIEDPDLRYYYYEHLVEYKYGDNDLFDDDDYVDITIETSKELIYGYVKESFIK